MIIGKKARAIGLNKKGKSLAKNWNISNLMPLALDLFINCWSNNFKLITKRSKKNGKVCMFSMWLQC